jgi:hypothetical protein
MAKGDHKYSRLFLLFKFVSDQSNWVNVVILDVEMLKVL